MVILCCRVCFVVEMSVKDFVSYGSPEERDGNVALSGN